MNSLVPTEFYLGQNYPNPFKEKTTIKYCLAYKTNVKIKVIDSEGRVIETLVDEEKNAGTYKVEFQPLIGKKQLPAGRYFYVFKAGNYSNKKEMILFL